MKMRFGKYKGEEIEDVPQSYLEWLVTSTVDNLEYKAELERRKESQSRPGVGKVITDAQDKSIESLYAIIKRMPESLFNRDIVLERKYKVRIEKV